MTDETEERLLKEIEELEKIVKSHYNHCSSMRHMDEEQINDIQKLKTKKAQLEQHRRTKAECKEKFKEMKEYFDKLELPDLECHFCGNTTYCNFIHRTDVINKIDEELQKADEVLK